MKINEVMETRSTETQEVLNKLGNLEAMVISLENKLGAENVQWPRLDQSEAGASQRGSGPDTVMTEIYERRSRENNLVIYGVPESSSSENHERIEHDKKFATDLMQTCGISSQDLIHKVLRLGKKRDDNRRPLLLKLTDTHTKPKIFRNLRNLKGLD